MKQWEQTGIKDKTESEDKAGFEIKQACRLDLVQIKTNLADVSPPKRQAIP